MTIPTPNYTQIPNIFFDYWMEKLSPPEFKVLLCIARKTFGWHKAKDQISFNQIVSMSGLSRRAVINCIDRLVEKQLITKTTVDTKQGGKAPNLYEVNVQTVHIECASGAHSNPNNEGGVVHNMHQGGSAPRAPTKETTYTKEKKESRAAPSVTADAATCALFLLEKIKEWKPNFKEPNLAQWGRDIDLMLRMDKRTIQEIKDVITWAQADSSFWRANVLSAAKLRKQFDQLQGQMQRTEKVKTEKMDPLAWCQQYWKNGNYYSGAECTLNQEGISFVRSMKYDNVFFKYRNWKDKLKDICSSFGIQFPQEGTQEAHH
jgi:phage replication O-like protein O